MKKFFKALAVVLALTLVIGTIPASAATTVKAKKSKVLYVGGARGTDNDGNKSVLKRRVTYAKLLGITKAEAKKLKVTAKSSDAKIAKANNDTRRVGAKGIGTATVTLTCEGKKYDVKVVVRKNADKVTFGEDWADINETLAFEAAAGQTYTVSLPRFSGKTKLDTDERRLEADESVIITPVEGKARVWTIKFTKAGEYKVTGIAYQSENLPAATASQAVTVTVIGADFSAEQSGRNSFTVYGTGFTKDTKFTIKRGNTDIKYTIKEVNDSQAILETEAKLTKATYTVAIADTDNKVDVAVDDEVVKDILILEDENKTNVKTSKFGGKNNTFYVHYKIVNNFDEDVTKYYSLDWVTSYGTLLSDNKNEGVVSFRNNAGGAQELYMGFQVSVTGTYKGSTYSRTKSAILPVGLELMVGKIEFFKIYNMSTKKAYDSLNTVEFQPNEYAIAYTMKDQDGFNLAYENGAHNADLTFVSTTPLLLQVEQKAENNSVTIDGIEYPIVLISKKGVAVKEGGKATVMVTSKSGQQSELAFDVKPKQVLASFEFVAPGFDIIDGKTYTLDYIALDEDGNKIDDFEVLRGALTVNTANLWVEEDNNGKAVLKYKAKTATDAYLGATKYVNYPVVLMAMVNTGTSVENTQLQITVKADDYANQVKGIETSGRQDLYIVEGGYQDIQLAKDIWNVSYLTFFDQYSNTLGNGFELSATETEFQGYQVWAEYNPANITIETRANTTGSPLLAGTCMGTAIYDAATGHSFVNCGNVGSNFFRIYANSNVTATKDESTVTFFLYNPNAAGLTTSIGGANRPGARVAGSDKNITFTIVDMSQFNSFSFAGDTLSYDGDASQWAGTGAVVRDKYSKSSFGDVKGSISGASTEIWIPTQYVKYSITSGLINGSKYQDVATTPSGSAVTLDMDSITDAVGGTREQNRAQESSHNTFVNYKGRAVNGLYPYQFATLKVQASVYNTVSQGSVTVDYATNLCGVVSQDLKVGLEDSKITEFVKSDDPSAAGTWRRTWTDFDKNEATIKPANGIITGSDLETMLLNHLASYELSYAANGTTALNAVGNVSAKDTYGKKRGFANSYVTIEVSNYQESDARLYSDKTADTATGTPGMHSVTGNGVTLNNTLSIDNIEWGDKFDVTFKAFDGTVVLTVHVTAGSDTRAKIDTTGNTPTWY